MTLRWPDLSRAVRLKTAYIASVVFFVGVALIGISFVFRNTLQALILALGGTLVTSSVFSIITEATLRLDILDEFLTELDALRIEVRGLLPGERVNGVQLLANRRDFNFTEFMKEARGVVRASGFSANDLLAVSNLDHIYQAIIDGRIKCLRVILLDPYSAAAAARAKQPAYRHERALRDKTEAITAELGELSARLSNAGYPACIKLHYAKEAVTVSLAADDYTAIVTPIVRTKTGGTSPTYIFNRQFEGKAFYDVYREHFESLATSSIERDLGSSNRPQLS